MQNQFSVIRPRCLAAKTIVYSLTLRNLVEMEQRNSNVRNGVRSKGNSNKNQKGLNLLLQAGQESKLIQLWYCVYHP